MRRIVIPDFSVQKGFSLVELMVGIAVGLFVVLSATTVYLNATASARDANQANRLNQDIRAIVDVMVSDIRRAGYWAGASPASGSSNNPFMARDVDAKYRNGGVSPADWTDVNISSDGSCVLYTYDKNLDGVVGVDEFFGFRYNSANKTIEALVSGLDSTEVCSGGTWAEMNTPTDVLVTGLSFSGQGSRCLATNVDDTSSSADWQSTNRATAACEQLTPANLGSVAVPLRGIETRQIAVELKARHAKEEPASERTITEVFVVRNGRILG